MEMDPNKSAATPSQTPVSTPDGSHQAAEFSKMQKRETEPIELGRTIITSRAKHTLTQQEVLAALWRHARENWDASFDPEATQGPAPSKEDRRLVSDHSGSRGQAFKIATGTLARVTTVFLASETADADAGLLEAWLCNPGCPTCGG